MEFKHYTLSKVSNAIFYTLSVFILTFIWVNFTLKNIKKSFVCAIIITLTILILTFVFKKFKNSFKSKKQILETKKKIFDINLLLNNDKENISKILQAFNLDNNLTTINQNHKIDSEKEIDYFFSFENHTITNENIIKLIKSRIYNNIVIFCINNNCNFENTSINIDIITSDNIFNKIEEKSLSIPEIVNLTKPTKFTAKMILCTVFNKSKSKHYFIFGLTLIIMSLYTIYHTYYIVCGTILILLSLYSRFNKFFNKKTCSDINNISHKFNN